MNTHEHNDAHRAITFPLQRSDHLSSAARYAVGTGSIVEFKKSSYARTPPKHTPRRKGCMLPS
jgi:hypothetical protein